MWCQKWDCQAVPFLGPRFIFQSFLYQVAEVFWFPCNFVAFGDRTGNQSVCCNFLFVPRVGLCFEFHDLIFGTARSHFGTVFNHFSKFFVSELQKCNVWVAL